MMGSIQTLITDHIDVWTGADTEKKSGRGRASGNAASVYGIKKLRELILELAVRGKLVPQDASDEPASELLKRITEEKNKLIADGNIRKSSPSTVILDNEKPFELPTGWIWSRFGDVMINRDGERKPVSSDERSTRKGDFDYYGASGVIDKIDDFLFDKPLLLIGEDGANLISRSTPIAFIARGKYWVNNHAHVLDGISEGLLRFIELYINAINLEPYVTGTAQPKMNQAKMNSIVIALAPEAEQHGIVAKVDELMALCDQLENQHTDAIAAHEKLVSYLLDTLTQSKDAADFNESWQRIAANFEMLFTTESSIEALKQTLLQLAVMGKLVPQDEYDEPASELLKRIQAEKAKLVAEGKIKKSKPLAEIGGDEKPFELPIGWQWVGFGLISEFINGDRGKNYPNREEYVDDGIPWINTGHIEPDGTLSVIDMNYITNEKFNTLNGGKIKEDDLVYCLRGATFGKTAFVTPYSEGAVASSLMIIRPHLSELKFFIYKYLICPFGKSQVYRFNNGSAQPNLSSASVGLYAFPLPPLPEQHRIVTKVDELMTLCDTLKSRITAANRLQQKIADVMVEQAVA